MSGSEHGRETSVRSDGAGGERVEVKRAASPAKRSAHQMEESEGGEGQQALVNGDSTTNGYVMMDGISQSKDAQDTVASSLQTSVQGSMHTDTSAMSMQSQDPPPYTENAEDAEGLRSQPDAVPSYDEQERQVMEAIQQPFNAGDRGFVVSAKWLQRVQSRTTEGLKSSEYPKDVREGDIGPVDNSDIVPPNAFAEPILVDVNKQLFIPLRLDTGLGTDYQILPERAWGHVVGWYGITRGQKQIARYAVDTAGPEATTSNMVYELHPPVFTVRKFPHPNNEVDDSAGKDKSRSSANALRLRAEGRGRGQSSPDDALKLVSSRVEHYQKFLARAKEYAGIQLQNRVKVWRLLRPTAAAVNEPDNGPSPPPSPQDSPSRLLKSERKLVVEKAEWEKMEVGKDIEHVDAADQTHNPNYNGKGMKMELFQLFENQTLILEEQLRGPAGVEYSSDNKKPSTFKNPQKAGSKPGSSAPSGRNSPAPSGGMMTRGRTRRDGRTRGTVGLSNLGNTCYMNSALQCIRSVEELAIYFLQDKYKEEINMGNPLGTKGIMAKKYAEVLNGIYGDDTSSFFSPGNFKRTLSNINPVFSGWGQQDSQEFLSYLVDTVHEDLNRIEKKPYLENPDSDDARVMDPEYIKELGDIYQKHHYARNASVCMDLFSGFYKNTMECPVCDKVSVTFDPFASLTLQLPMENTINHTFTFVPINGSPINHDLDLEKNLTIKDVKKIIASKHPNVDFNKLWMVEVYSHKVYKHFDDRTTMSEAGIQANDYIFLYELSGVPKNIPPPTKTGHYTMSTYGKKAGEIPDMDSEMADNFAVPIFHRFKTKSYNSYNSWDVKMHPQYISVTREEAKNHDVLFKKVLYAVAQITSRPILMEADQNEHAQPAESDEDESTTKPEQQKEDSIKVSDHSVPSEDGYVSISVDGAEGDGAQTTQSSTSTAAKIPAEFMVEEYTLPSMARNQLFVMNYAKGSENMLCTGMNGFDNKGVRNMHARVKLPSRRGSVASTSSRQSSASVVKSDADDSDADASDDGDRVPALTTTEDSQDDPIPATSDNDELPANTLEGTPRSGRRRGNGKENKFKGSKGKKRKDKLHGKKNKRNGAGRPAGHASVQSPRSTQDEQSEDDPYYIKLGEGIVLDWHPEAVEGLFEGDAGDESDLRGRFLSQEDGKGLPFMSDPATEAKRKRREQRKKHGITLEDCFAETNKREKLSEDNAWYCNRCKELRQATKTLDIWTCPDIVVVHLKRFGGTRSFRDKIDVLVEYPLEGLDLTEKIGQKEDGKEYIYDLFAVDNHFGGLGGGHYTAYAKNFFDKQWYDYNDSNCSKMGEKPRTSASAYLLFYRRRSSKPLGPQYLQELVEEYHNPPQQTNSADEAYESDSGEGRLGDPSSILHGSSRSSVGAGAGAQQSQQLRGGGDGSAGAQAGQNLKPRTQGTSDDEGIGMGDDEEAGNVPLSLLDSPTSPHTREYGNQGTMSWTFDGIDGKDNNADNCADTLLNEFEDTNDQGSTTAEMDDSDRMDNVSPIDDHWNDGEISLDAGGMRGDDYEDDHAMYSGAHGRNHGMETLRLEEAGMVDNDPPTMDIELSPDRQEEHNKID